MPSNGAGRDGRWPIDLTTDPGRGFDEALAYASQWLARTDLGALRENRLFLEPFQYYVFGSIYPPLKAMAPMRAEEVYVGSSSALNLYVHIPFCDQHCTFCHFAKEIRPTADRVERYLDALAAELALVRPHLPADAYVQTMYVGGGTASYLDADQIRRVFRDLRSRLDFAPDAEISYELHPNIVRRPDRDERLAAMRECGVNRWVYGAQSTDDQVLRKLNRGHSGDDVVALLDLLRPFAAGNVSIDLIFGLPYQTLPQWYDTLTRLVEAQTPKFNIFPLMFKIGDPITRHYLREPEIFPDAEERLLMHYLAEHVLVEQAGYNFGPVFYYSQPAGPASRQQVSKFEDIDRANLLGLGVSAFGYVGGTHYYNECTIDGYCEAVEGGRLPTWMGIHLSDEERMRRTVIQSLRANGVSRAAVVDSVGLDPFDHLADEFALLTSLGLVDVVDDTAVLTGLGAAHADGIGTLFVSEAVASAIHERNEHITASQRPTRDLVERFDFTPVLRRNEAYVELLPTRRSAPNAVPSDAPNAVPSVVPVP